MKKFLGALLGLSLLILAGPLAASQDDDFIAAREAFRTGDSARLDVYAKRLQGHVLEPYASYYQLRLYLEDTEPAIVKAFLSRYQDSLLADKLRGEWLKILGKKQQWELFAAEYPALVNEDAEITCYALQQRLAMKDNAALTEARPLWLNAGGRDLPESCTPLFDALVAAKLLNLEDVWIRLRLALEAGNLGVAKHVNQYLPKNLALDERRLNAAADNSLRYLEKHRTGIKSRADHETALFAMLRLLRSGPDQAYAYWPRVREKFSAADQSYFMKQLATQAARRLDPRALGWFGEVASSAAPSPLSDLQLTWKTRAALRAGDWVAVLESIEAMSALEQQTGAWRYWKARALKAKGKTADANTILVPLSVEHNFYGQLAEEELGTSVSAATSAPSYWAGTEEITAMRQLPEIQRALALYRLDLRTEATREWNWSIRNFNDRRLLTAAEIASRNEIHDRAINTADRTVLLHNFSLRFPAPHREAMQEVLKQQELDEAWVYGLIRQESRFVSNARSSAGASGLMQLMPATAKWVAKKMGMRDYRKALATEIDTNLALGTYYLKHVLTSLDNQPLLASAAYNAGPGRARQWRDVKPLEGAIYAETIPFTETRDYVKKVLSNSMYYASAFGQHRQSLKQRLGIVAPKLNGETPSEPEK